MTDYLTEPAEKRRAARRKARRLSGVFLGLFLLALAPDAWAQPEQTTSPPRDRDLALYKSMSLEDLMKQEVTSVSRQPEPLAEAPAAIQVISQDDIRRSGAMTIPDALRLAGNLDVAQATAGSWDISARGFNGGVSDKLLVLMDGRTLYTPLLEGVIWNMQDYLLADLDRIEVVSGPGGTLWGANAVNGVINITSKDARDTQGVYIETGGGTELNDFAGVRYGGTLASNVYFRAYVKYFDRGSEVFTNGVEAGDSWNRGQGGFRIDDERSAQNHLTLQGDYYAGDTYVPTNRVGRAAGGNLLGRWTHTFSDESDMSLQLYYDRTHIVAPFQGLGAFPPGNLTDNLDTYDLDFQDRFPLGDRNHVIWGLGYRFTHDSVSNAPAVGFLPPTLERDLFSAFLQDEVKIFDRLFLTLGSKIEHNDYTGFEYEPSGRLQWNISDRQMVWAAISRAVRMPSRYDRDLFEPPPPGLLLVGNNTFRSESVVAYEAGYRAHLGARASGSISAYYNDYDHLRSVSLTPVTFLPVYYQNNLVAQTYGFEFSGDYQATKWWRWHASYDLQRDDIHVRPGQIDAFLAHNETADPQQQFQIRWAFDLTRDIDLDTALRWVDRIQVNSGSSVATLPSYFELNARLAWRPAKHWELALVGENLLHTRHVEYGFPSSSQEEIDRAVYGKLTFSW
ncbi:MAG TPA: TonB-dependent receptor [Verrucomicrobiae bacterium]|nr:TonB-dependent receptor [Verrucomicrobiae bacterium]